MIENRLLELAILIVPAGVLAAFILTVRSLLRKGAKR